MLGSKGLPRCDRQPRAFLILGQLARLSDQNGIAGTKLGGWGELEAAPYLSSWLGRINWIGVGICLKTHDSQLTAIGRTGVATISQCSHVRFHFTTILTYDSSSDPNCDYTISRLSTFF